jgi:hypothetical protein
MEIKFVVWSNGDSSVGDSGRSFKVSLKIDPSPDFDEMEEGDQDYFVDFLEKNLKISLLGLKDYFDNEYQIHIETVKDFQEQEESENKYETYLENIKCSKPYCSYVESVYLSEFKVIDGLNQHPDGLNFDDWCQLKKK